MLSSISFRCQDCLLLDVTLQRCRQLIQSSNLTTDHRRRLLASFHYQTAAIEAWKCHQLRSVVQDEARCDVIERLNDTNVSRTNFQLLADVLSHLVERGIDEISERRDII